MVHGAVSGAEVKRVQACTSRWCTSGAIKMLIKHGFRQVHHLQMVHGAVSGAIFPANRDFAPTTAPPAPSPPLGGGVAWCMVQTMPRGADELFGLTPLGVGWRYAR